MAFISVEIKGFEIEDLRGVQHHHKVFSNHHVMLPHKFNSLQWGMLNE